MRHNKKRNSALLYEFLVRHISSCLVNDNKGEAKKAVLLSRKYFSNGSLLKKELDLFNAVLDTNVKSKHSAHKILEEVYSGASKLNARRLDAEKSALIKEINHTFDGSKIYGYKIPNYTVCASIQTLLSECRNKKKILNSVSKIKLEDSIIEHLVRDDENRLVDSLRVNPDYNNAVYKFVIKRFNEKYSKKLNEGQKRLLTKYAVYLISENKGIMKSAMLHEIKNVKDKLRTIKDESIHKDSDLVKKLSECYKQFVVTDFESITESNVLSLLQYMKLAEEIDS